METCTKRPLPWLVVLAAGLLVPSALAVTGQSLWTDEAISAFFADHARLWHLDSFPGISGISNMPLYHLLLTMWVSLWGDSERALRGFNLPFALLFLSSILFLCWRSRRCSSYFVAVLFSVYPLLIYYVNEARPYTALLGLSAAATVSFLAFIEKPTLSAAWFCCLFTLSAVAMHLFGVLCPLSFMIFICLRRDVRHRLIGTKRLWLAPILLATFIVGVAGIYYLSARGIASKASVATTYPDTPINIPSSWRNLVFVLYECLGFSGLGPPRNDLRLHPNIHAFLPYIGWMAAGLIAFALLGAGLLKAERSAEIRNAYTLLIAAGLSLLILSVAARQLHFGFYGRHAMSLIGVVSCSLALLLLAPETRLARVALAALLFIWTMSSVRLLYIYSYGKDDVRSALQVAACTRLPILWNASVVAPDRGYYNTADPQDAKWSWLSPPPLRSRQHWVLVTEVHGLQFGSEEYINAEAARLTPGTYVLVKGKADLADPRGLWGRKFAEWNPRLLNRFNGYDVLLLTVRQHQTSRQLHGPIMTRHYQDRDCRVQQMLQGNTRVAAKENVDMAAECVGMRGELDQGTLVISKNKH